MQSTIARMLSCRRGSVGTNLHEQQRKPAFKEGVELSNPEACKEAEASFPIPYHNHYSVFFQVPSCLSRDKDLISTFCSLFKKKK